VKVVSVINHKGGVGKTTLTANLGAGLAARGHRVLLVDLDSQASLTVSFVSQDEWHASVMPTRTIKRWYEAIGTEGALPDLSNLIYSPTPVRRALTEAPGYLDLIAAHRDLADVDVDLAVDVREDAGRYVPVHRRLRDGLRSRALSEYDVVLVDCAPHFGILARNAVLASDLLLIPTKPDYLSTNGVDSLAQKVHGSVREFNERLLAGRGRRRDVRPVEVPAMAVVFTMVQTYAEQPIETQRTYISRVEALGAPTFESYVRENKVVYGPSPEHGVPVILGGTNRAQTRELRHLVDELSTRLERIPA
jgi:chromosome partitioning protein